MGTPKRDLQLVCSQRHYARREYPGNNTASVPARPLFIIDYERRPPPVTFLAPQTALDVPERDGPPNHRERAGV